MNLVQKRVKTMAKGIRGGTGGFLRDFQDFILRGNVVDLAVAVIIGGAFTKIINAFVAWLMAILLQPLLEKANVNKLQDLPLGLGAQYRDKSCNVWSNSEV